MKKTGLLLFLLLWTACNSYKPAPKDKQINEADKEVYDILNAVLESINEDKIYLYDSISSSHYNYWITGLTDPNVLECTDSLLLKQYLKKPKLKLFFEPELIEYYQKNEKKMKPDSKYLTSKIEIELLDSLKNENYPKYIISYPILSLDKQYAWVSISKYTEDNTGYFKVQLFNKEKGKWKYFSTVDKIKHTNGSIFKRTKKAIPVSSIKKQ